MRIASNLKVATIGITAAAAATVSVKIADCEFRYLGCSRVAQLNANPKPPKLKHSLSPQTRSPKALTPKPKISTLNPKP